MHKHKTPICRVYPLSFRKIWKKLIALEIGRGGTESRKMWRPIVQALALVTVIIFVFAYMSYQGDPTFDWTRIVSLMLAIWGIVYILFALYLWLYVWTYYYDFDEYYLRVRKGVIIRREVTIPYERIHDVYLDQDVLDHIFGLHDLYVATASEMSLQEAHIDGLDKNNAYKLRDLLMHEITESNNPEAKRRRFEKLDNIKNP